MKKKLSLSALKVKSFMTSESADIKGGKKGQGFDIGTNPIATENGRGCLEPASKACHTNGTYVANPMCWEYTQAGANCDQAYPTDKVCI